MARLTLHFNEGFDGDRAEVRVDGRSVLDLDALRTDYSIGLARTVTAEVPDGPVHVEVVMPDRGLHSDARYSVSGALVVDVRVTPGGELEQHRTEGDRTLF